MQFTLAHVLSFLPFLAQASPVPELTRKSHPSHTAEIYFLTNCFNNVNLASYAEFDWYANSTLTVLGGHTTLPDLKNVINTAESVDYEDETWFSLPGSPFNLTVVIGADAYTAKQGTQIGTATSSTFAGTMKCERLTRVIPYTTSTVTCYSDYACVESGTVFPQ